ncbi:HET-domain-containing protein [Xylariaceae sp. FL1651]|nr:HET-domain-containing protein [Xylariaceae sp. FL1651]
MDLYEYSPLDDETCIRLVTILPGGFKDPIQIEVRHESLIEPGEIKSTRLSLKEIRETLPEDWWAGETLEGRFIFQDDIAASTTWVHPDPSFDRVKYDPVSDSGKRESLVPTYEALSYTWGAPEKDEVAVVKKTRTMRASFGSTFRRVLPARRARSLPITRNLADALRHLRYSDRSRTMWIDAICIDQGNDQERSKQVQRMGQIFSLAGRVVAWLGPSFPDSSLALTTLSSIGQQLEWTRDKVPLPSPQCSHPDWHSEKVCLPFGTKEFAAITQLCKAEYFGRLWVVQELQLGNAESIIKCGSEEIPWPLFRRAVLCIHYKPDGIPPDLRDTLFIPAELCNYLRNSSIRHMLYYYSGRECADDKDNVYGLMNLLDSDISNCIIVDYSRSTSVLDAFQQVFLAFTEQEQRVAQLQCSGRRYGETSARAASAWPTWLPNWSQFVYLTVPFELGFGASSTSAARAKYISPHKIEIKGVSLGTISIVSEPLDHEQGFLGVVEMLKGLGLEQLRVSRYITGGTLLDAYLQTILRGVFRERFQTDSFIPLDELREEAIRVAAPSGSTEQSIIASSYHDMIKNSIKSTYMFTMSSGYIGIICGYPRLGDEVFVILGCDVPMLLRQTRNAEYEVVGDCYVHGIMDGELLLGALLPPWTVKVELSEDGAYRVEFHSDKPDAITADDPRLTDIPLPTEWEPVEFEWTPADPFYCKKFRNKNTGEIINSDPRLFPEALVERGVPVKTITLV